MTPKPSATTHPSSREEANHPEPITITVARDVAPGREADFLDWAETMFSIAGFHEGYLGGGILRPGMADEPWHMIYRFRDPDSFAQWEHSPDRTKHLAAGEAFMHHKAERRFTGLETWFALPEQATEVPARWKMAIVSFAAALPLSLLVNLVVAPRLHAPAMLRPLLSVATLVIWLTWIAMPKATQLLRGWLYPERRPPVTAVRTRP